MHKRLPWIAAWIILFGATLLARSLFGDKQELTINGSQARELSDRLKDELLRMPRRFEHLKDVGDSTETSANGSFTKSLIASISQQRKGLVRCLDIVMRQSNRTVEHFEVSFLAARPQGARTSTIALTNVRLERATFTITRDAEQCIVDEIEKIEIAAETAPNERLSHPMCFSD